MTISEQLEQLTNILKLLKLRPASGWGKTTIVWRNGNIFIMRTREDILPENIN